MAYRREALEHVDGSTSASRAPTARTPTSRIRVQRAGGRLVRGLPVSLHPVPPATRVRQRPPPGRQPRRRAHVAPARPALAAGGGGTARPSGPACPDDRPPPRGCRRAGGRGAGASARQPPLAWAAATTEFALLPRPPGPEDGARDRRHGDVEHRHPAARHRTPRRRARGAASTHGVAGDAARRAARPRRDARRGRPVQRRSRRRSRAPRRGGRGWAGCARPGLRLALVSNQSGIARGLLSAAQVDAVNRRLEELVGPPRRRPVLPARARRRLPMPQAPDRGGAGRGAPTRRRGRRLHPDRRHRRRRGRRRSGRRFAASSCPRPRRERRRWHRRRRSSPTSGAPWPASSKAAHEAARPRRAARLRRRHAARRAGHPGRRGWRRARHPAVPRRAGARPPTSCPAWTPYWYTRALDRSRPEARRSRADAGAGRRARPPPVRRGARPHVLPPERVAEWHSCCGSPGCQPLAAISRGLPGSLLDVRHRVPDDVHEVERSLSAGRDAEGFRLPSTTTRATSRITGVEPPPAFLDGVEIVVHPGASVPARAWPAERHRALVEQLVRRGHRVAVTGGRDEIALTAARRRRHGCHRRRRSARRSPQLAGAPRGRPAAPWSATPARRTSQPPSPRRLSPSTPTPSPPVRFRPWAHGRHAAGHRRRAVRRLPRPHCPVPGHPCMAAIDVPRVVAAVEAHAARSRANGGRQ